MPRTLVHSPSRESTSTRVPAANVPTTDAVSEGALRTLSAEEPVLTVAADEAETVTVKVLEKPR